MDSGAEISVSLLSHAGVRLGTGLTEKELRAIEREFHFRFDSDHRELLSLVTPLGDQWFDWRGTSRSDVRAQLTWPIDGVLWDVQHNGYWPRAWGSKPSREKDVERMALKHLKSVPTLVPIFGHRFIPAGPSRGSAPVFSVMQTDVVILGDNLPSYVAREVKIPKEYRSGVHRHIPFWSSLAEEDDNYFDWPIGESRSFRNLGVDGKPMLPPVQRDGTPITYQTRRVADSREVSEASP